MGYTAHARLPNATDAQASVALGNRACTVYPIEYAHGFVNVLRCYGYIIFSLGWCKTDVTPLLTHWSYVSFTQPHRVFGGFI